MVTGLNLERRCSRSDAAVRSAASTSTGGNADGAGAVAAGAAARSGPLQAISEPATIAVNTCAYFIPANSTPVLIASPHDGDDGAPPPPAAGPVHRGRRVVELSRL